MQLNYVGKTVLVTGSSRGIGNAIARAFVKEGASVWLTGRSEDSLHAAQRTMECVSGSVFTFAGDLSDTDTCDVLAKELDANDGGLDVLVCNIGSGKSVPLLHETQEEWRRVFDVNLFSATAAVYALLPSLRKAAARKGDASIVFISSICGEEALGCPLAYSSAKSALNSFAKTLARPLGKDRVRVNIVSPGNVMFPGSTWENKVQQNPDGVEAMLQKEVPLARLGTADEVADVVVFLASERASFVTGADWIVDGGQTRRI